MINNRFTTFISRYVSKAALALALTVAVSSCGSVFDELDPCPSGAEMRFIYDYNLEHANAFPSQVDCLTLHIYDSEGRHISTLTEPGTSLADENWRMRLDLPAGKYHAVAYGGIACSDASFAHVPEPATGNHYRDISMQLLPSHAGKRLHDHFHGELDFELDPMATDYTRVTMKMTKTTNHFRILLQHLNGDPVDGRDYDFSITDDHIELDHANTPVPGHPITYPAWTSGQVNSYTSGDDDARAVDVIDHVSVGYAELSTSRIHLSTTPRLIVRHKATDTEIINIPIADYMLMMESDASKYTPQEYLDRCSQWNFIFLLDKADHWFSTRFIVNGWTVRINNIEK